MQCSKLCKILLKLRNIVLENILFCYVLKIKKGHSHKLLENMHINKFINTFTFSSLPCTGYIHTNKVDFDWLHCMMWLGLPNEVTVLLLNLCMHSFIWTQMHIISIRIRYSWLIWYTNTFNFTYPRLWSKHIWILLTPEWC